MRSRLQRTCQSVSRSCTPWSSPRRVLVEPRSAPRAGLTLSARLTVTARDRRNSASFAAIAVTEPRLHVERQGSGPAVVLAHGFGGSARNFRPQARALADACTLLTYDARG